MADQSKTKFIFGGLILLGIAARIYFLPVVSLDVKYYLLPWYDHILSNGAWTSLAQEFSNYTPPYLYLLSLVVLTNGLLPKVLGIKLIPILFDLLNAFMVFRIVKLQAKDDRLPWVASALFLCLPTVILNSAAWAQADSIYTFFLLASLFYLLREKPLPGIILFGVAFACKAQAIFFAPFLLLLTLKKRIPWGYYLLVPLVYLLLMLPSLLAGRPFASVLEVYLDQAGTFNSLSMKAPNLYLFIPNEYYMPGLYIGIGITVLATLIWSVGYAVKIKRLNLEIMVLCAAVSVAMIPFLLPKMHERYFYLMDVLTFLLVFFIPRLWIPAVGAQLVSTLTYSVFLFISSQKVPSPLGAVLLILAAAINIFLVPYIFFAQHKFIRAEQT
jgi:Gpi18-like mannosyltransferase